MRAIVQAFKYGGHQTLGPRLAAHLATHPHLHLDSVDIVVPVPLHPWRRLTRGFNQAERVARALGAPVAHPLARLRWRPAQAGLPAEARRGNVHGTVGLWPSFTARGAAAVRASVAGARVLLVDDVITTGGTLSACAQVLREAGAREVRAAVIARAER
ncbi:ComF family protein [Luteitalea sp.]|jgi:ComF family protein|uniref:ComF family protein n=1 Tax=Luteitalea sp. TaxID=2004800 RepID=UPI0037C51EC8